jgi:hypothetical protein
LVSETGSAIIEKMLSDQAANQQLVVELVRSIDRCQASGIIVRAGRNIDRIFADQKKQIEDCIFAMNNEAMSTNTQELP